MKGPSFYRGFCNTLEKRKGKEKKKEKFSLFFTQASYQTLTLTLTFNFCSEQLGGGGGLEIQANYILQVDIYLY